jgi:hypothetical protein
MTRLLLFLILCIASTHLAFGQYDTYSLEWGGGVDWFVVNSYNGGLSPEKYITLRLGSNQMKEAQWKITATVRNVTSKYNNGVEKDSDFPVGKLSIMCNAASGPSLGKIKDMYFWHNLEGKGNEVELVNFQSLYQAPHTYRTLLLDFQLHVHAGNYLSNYPNVTTIRLEIEYRLYTRNNNAEEWSYAGKSLISKHSHFDINIDPNSQVPVPDPVYSLTVSPEVLLEFNTISSYMNGVEKTCEKGLKVSASGNYEVRAKSQTSQFTSTTSSRTLPLDLVSLQLSGGNGTQQPVNISTTNQLILQGTSTNGNVVEYDMIYKAKPIEDQYLIINNQETFTTQLMFEMTTN